MGLHTGVPQLGEEGYTGLDVIRASRIAAAGHGGQILLSSTAAPFVTGVETRDLGTHRLQGLPDPERILQVIADGLPRDFPPLRGTVSQLGDARRVVLADDSVLLREGWPGCSKRPASRSWPRRATPRTCCARSRRTSPTSRSSTSACRRRTPTRASAPRADPRALSRTPACSSSPSTSSRATRWSCSTDERRGRRLPAEGPRRGRRASSATRCDGSQTAGRRSTRRSWPARRPPPRDDPLDRADAARARGAGADGRGRSNRGDRRARSSSPTSGREARHEHLHEARAPGLDRRPPSRPCRARVPAG